MLSKIRENSQGVFAWIILILICVPFALWGIQNYVGGGSEAVIISVDGQEFFQQEVNQAYAQYSQNNSARNIPEAIMKKQALDKLIQDELLWQFAQTQNLVASDKAAKTFIKSLEYFQTDDEFDKAIYKAQLASQRISSAEFINRIKKVLVMAQFKRSVIESNFATEKDLEYFFKIQNQQRSIEVISIALEKLKQPPANEEIEKYYQQHQDNYLTAEQVAIEYVELSLDELAKQVKPSEEQLKTYFEKQKYQYISKERRKISHILFAFNKESKNDDKQQLKRALEAKQALEHKSFSVLATEVSDDELTAAKGGDLGLFNVGVMEKSFEDVASSLKLGEVSEPVKSAFGYHLIKVTELVPSEAPSFNEIKDKISTAFKKTEAENTFYQLGETLAEVSYENPNSLQAVAEALAITIEKTKLFPKNPVAGEINKQAIFSHPKIIKMAFSENVLQGNNSEPIDIGTDSLIVLRLLEHKPATLKALKDVKASIVKAMLHTQSIQIAKDKAEKIKTAVINGQSMQAVATENSLTVKKFPSLTRTSSDVTSPIRQAVFNAAKPVAEKPTVLSVADTSGSQTIINLLTVQEGVMSEDDKAKAKLAKTNMSRAFGQTDFIAIIENLQKNAEVIVNTNKES